MTLISLYGSHKRITSCEFTFIVSFVSFRSFSTHRWESTKDKLGDCSITRESCPNKKKKMGLVKRQNEDKGKETRQFSRSFVHEALLRSTPRTILFDFGYEFVSVDNKRFSCPLTSQEKKPMSINRSIVISAAISLIASVCASCNYFHRRLREF